MALKNSAVPLFHMQCMGQVLIAKNHTQDMDSVIDCFNKEIQSYILLRLKICVNLRSANKNLC